MVLGFLEHQCRQQNTGLRIAFRDDRSPIEIAGVDKSQKVEIITGDPKFFTNILSARSPRHWLVLAPELLTSISDPELFTSVFTLRSSTTTGADRLDGWTNRVRHAYAVYLWKYSLIAPPPDVVSAYAPHWSTSLSPNSKLQVLFVVCLAFVADYLETEILLLIGARFVDGHEPWKIWERALRREQLGTARATEQEEFRSVTSSKSEDWVDLGSVQY